MPCRIELAPGGGIQVITLQPGGIVSRFGENASQHISQTSPNSIYSSVAAFIERRTMAGQRGVMDAAELARRVVQAVSKTHPPRVLRWGTNCRRLPFYQWALPKALTDRISSQLFGLNKMNLKIEN